MTIICYCYCKAPSWRSCVSKRLPKDGQYDLPSTRAKEKAIDTSELQKSTSEYVTWLNSEVPLYIRNLLRFYPVHGLLQKSTYMYILYRFCLSHSMT